LFETRPSAPPVIDADTRVYPAARNHQPPPTTPSAPKQTPKSVCLLPGGYAESYHAESYKVVLNKRRGFARLAAATGASLVPVIGIGEPFVCGEPCDSRLGLIFKAVLA
jgi:hypothetical protein